MARKITVDPAKLESAAHQIDTNAADYLKTYKQLFTEVDTMASAWQGTDNVAFTTQIKGFEEDFQKMHKLMTQYSAFLQDSAKTYRKTQGDVTTEAKKLTN